MRLNALLLAALWVVIPLMLTGCRSPFYADHGALLGGLAGAGIGAAVGEHNDNALAGALIGGAAGTLTGAVVGNGIDNDIAHQNAIIEAKLGRRIAGAAKPEDVAAMAAAGVDDTVIINYIRANGVARPLTTNDVIALHNAGVRPHVIDALQNPPVPVAAPPAVVPVYAPPPPRPVIITGPPYFRPGPPPCRPPHWHSRRRSRIGFSYHHHF